VTVVALLDVADLSVTFPSQGGAFRAVDRVSFSLEQQRVLGVVGESGSGKSVAMLALMGLVPYPGQVSATRLAFDGRDLLRLSARERRRIVGKDVAMIFQDPTTSLNPSFTVGWQIEEALREHMGLGSRAARTRSIELLEQVGIPAPETRLAAYPHQLSGGMSQRVMIAMAISCQPRVLIADEPTTALDVTIQAQILDLLRRLQHERGMALILISHNMGVVAEMADTVAVMYAGQVVETKSAATIFEAPQHPYTAALLAALPDRSAGGRLSTIPGVVPGAYDRPAGCLFAPRCAWATPKAEREVPILRDWGDGQVRCHHPLGEPNREQNIASERGGPPL
jgi:dipeptide transport system ATP-binding protein